MKIIASFLIFVLVIFCAVSCGNAESGKDSGNTADTGAFTGGASVDDPIRDGKVSVKAEISENQVIAQVYIDGNPGVAAFNLELGFDKAILRPVSIEGATLISGATLLSNVQQGGDSLATLDSVTAYCFGASDFNGDGTLFTVIFDVLEGASGETEITLNSPVGGNVNQELKDIVFELQNCSITLG
ncbi:MAG: hypothetical protein E7671_03285 [Ruminococcaceae bacterium]|nr:hypothetical protein [Oscillospiraceae bacterium]